MLRTDRESLLERDRLGLPWMAWAVLLLTIVLSLVWSHARLLTMDEFFQIYTDSLPTLAGVLHVQLHYPVVIDPPVQHVVTHTFLHLFGANTAALRTPSMLAFLLFQACIYLFASRMAGKRAGILAMLFPYFTCTIFESQNGRPYALLMALFMLALVCWQKAARAEEIAAPRTLALVGLWLALALAISTQYFGILVLLPVWIGELVRTLSRRRIDKTMVSTLVLGTASTVLILPFLNATKVFRAHYVPSDTSWRFVMEIYRNILQDGPFQLAHHAQMSLIIVFFLAIVIAAALRLQRHRDTAFEWAAVATLALLPVFGHVLQVYITHTLLPRYVLPATGAFAVCGGLVLAAAMRKTAVFYATALLLLALGIGVTLLNVRVDRIQSTQILAACNEMPAVKAELDSHPADKIYFQTLTQYLIVSYYETDPQRRARLVLVTDQGQFKWLGGDGYNIITQNMRRFAPLPIVPYDDFLRLKNPLIVFYENQQDGDAWIDRDLKTRGWDVKPVGPWLRGTLAETRSPQ